MTLIGIPQTGIPYNVTLQPEKIRLTQNWPNPFNPATEIQYNLPEEMDITLMVYDIRGQLITRLAHGEQNAGIHRIHFNGEHLDSGIYFYQLKTEHHTLTRRMVLLK